MQREQLLKTILFSVWIIILAGCSDHYKAHQNLEKSRAETGDERKIKNHNTSYDEQYYLQIPEFLQNNIIYFALDKYDINLNFVKMLDGHANFLRSNPSEKVTIEGHADERGTPEYNIVLGERRANAVKMYLQSKGVLPEQIMILSYGKAKPAVFGHYEAAYAKNRRAILVYSLRS
ncbi:peptidoglycan-associated lipoprotein Pal [Candidatus Palibaumannia cicadellinicola]|uniref:Peptidoglycan-associated lipoprotein n=1 Tax=Candidatus Palibaumannia cicadellinicola TaxID=186490 RepID=A0A088N0X4_9GAMM|nr:peptidoglycan-associated lipoprotein Pal [Candidatus Baumannia cicadellinicola]AIN47001.1 18K peptidoglycan-associated outer membrane lipoprotein; Peptidoglycan-associated lipoprotein precursor; Outer membrane protein P6; OmpA/MotB precursor [Candidatus Baumannia cicadellinicola]